MDRCKGFCKKETFSVKKLIMEYRYTYYRSDVDRVVTVQLNKEPRIATKYTHVQKRAGLKHCKSCEYITAEPTTLARCPCCSWKYSTLIRDRKRDRLLRKRRELIIAQAHSISLPIPMPQITTQ